ncbi:potassium/proton antiporter [Allorhizobium sp. BGMRC 0089]|uniref:potassium/proton antiporter n=1 Tax=Allorhizobium sonneratiae TaxID=2934936 RepID=UPI002033E891|nr:potassium/proton antiporter [Allorhizobium sonneratiae]MCM2290909.1 potassium/proton antiporter [Allorhizobium sonneratiae]
MEHFYIVTLVLTALILLAAFSSLIAFRFGAPLLLLFLIIGLLAGEDGLGLHFNNHSVAYTIGSLALAVILFDSGYHTPLQAFRQAAGPSITMATFGVLLTAGSFGLLAAWILNFSLLQGLLLGSIVASTDAAAVFFLLRIGGINIRDKVRSSLEVESGTNDPMAIFLTMAIAGMLSAGKDHAGFDIGVVRLFLEQMGLGLILGLLGGAAIVVIVKKIPIDRGLLPIIVLALSMVVFSYTGAIGGSGFLAVYVAGIYAGNRKIPGNASITRFQEGMTWLAQIIMFLVLGLLATPSQFIGILVPGVVLGLFLVFVSRPLATWLCLIPFDYTQQEKSFISWVGLRGAVSILLAIVPVLSGLKHAETYFNITFIVVMISLVLQGWTIKPMAKKLGLIIPPRIGAIDKVELDLPGAAHHELLSYRVVADSPVLRGERIPRWAMPSLVIRDGKSMRYQYAGRLRENDQVYLFIAPGYSRLLDRLFASKAPVEEDDSEFFGTFTLSPSRSAAELDAAYGPGLISDVEKQKSLAELMESRLNGRAEYADRVRLGHLILIVRDIDENGHISAVGLSMEAVAPRDNVPTFLSLTRLLQWLASLPKNVRKQWQG